MAMRQDLIALMPNLRAFARSLCGNPTRADDLVQETLVKAWAKQDTFQQGTNLKAWLFTILRNTYLTEIRKRKREVEDVDDVLAGQLSVAAAQDDYLDFTDLTEALQKLGSDQREAILLVGAEGLSYEEAAAICGCAVGTIKSRVNRARNRLAELMHRDEATAA
ncbi:MAG: sigma-70 family RNA polymerase sigma factor [Pseudomonadota bacterium]